MKKILMAVVAGSLFSFSAFAQGADSIDYKCAGFTVTDGAV